MIPRSDADLDPHLPSVANYWVPRVEEVSEEGFGGFRDTWLLFDVQVEEAVELLAEDRRLTQLADAFASDSYDYEAIANAIEYQDIEGLPEGVRENIRFPELEDTVGGDYSPLQGLELGVAGLVFALSAAGFLPAASCRSHVGEHSWSPCPVVVFATDEEHAARLAPLVTDARCGFQLDEGRPGLLAVCGPSAKEMHNLAGLVLDRVSTFGGQLFTPTREQLDELGLA